MRIAAAIGGLLGLMLLAGIFLHADLAGMWRVTSLAGGTLLWLAPYRLVFFLLYALGWAALLRPYNTGRRIGLAYLFWVTTVREAVDRLLPVASVGGSVVGVRLVHLRGLTIAAVGATVIVEILLTLAAVYLFTVIGLLLLVEFHPGPGGAGARLLLPALLLSLPVPVLTAVLLRYGSVFARLEGILKRIAGIDIPADGGASLDREIGACLGRKPAVFFAGVLELAALASGALEIWFVLRIVGHPIDIAAALTMESLMQAMRHLAFVVPSGIGVQEAALIVFGHTFGVSSELALTVSLAKRVREVLCGAPALISWWLIESRRRSRAA